eukprot:m.18933 g.18933  ORF g.18933 m.18933 type:complete len:423 (-) comp8585_c0_seq1:129-1397(-)
MERYLLLASVGPLAYSIYEAATSHLHGILVALCTLVFSLSLVCIICCNPCRSFAAPARILSVGATAVLFVPIGYLALSTAHINAGEGRVLAALLLYGTLCMFAGGLAAFYKNQRRAKKAARSVLKVAKVAVEQVEIARKETHMLRFQFMGLVAGRLNDYIRLCHEQLRQKQDDEVEVASKHFELITGILRVLVTCLKGHNLQSSMPPLRRFHKYLERQRPKFYATYGNKAKLLEELGNVQLPEQLLKAVADWVFQEQEPQLTAGSLAMLLENPIEKQYHAPANLSRPSTGPNSSEDTTSRAITLATTSQDTLFRTLRVTRDVALHHAAQLPKGVRPDRGSISTSGTAASPGSPISEESFMEEIGLGIDTEAEPVPNVPASWDQYQQDTKLTPNHIKLLKELTNDLWDSEDDEDGDDLWASAV